MSKSLFIKNNYSKKFTKTSLENKIFQSSMLMRFVLLLYNDHH